MPWLRLAELREQFKAAIDADAESFNEVMAAFKKAKEHPEAQAEVEAATKKATLIPLVVAERAREVRQIIESLRPITNPRMASDLTVGVALAQCGHRRRAGECRDQPGRHQRRGISGRRTAARCGVAAVERQRTNACDIVPIPAQPRV